MQEIDYSNKMNIHLNKIIKNLVRILWEDNFDILELLGSINLFGWGMWLITHPTLFETFSAYKMLAQMGNEMMWGSLMFLIAFFKFIGVAADRYRIRKMVAMVATVLWIFLSVTFIQSSPQAILVFITAEIGVFSAWEYLRHSKRARIRAEIREENKETTL